tara:strand:+ start:393 stop:596 length:204 start_codon:yes stop_codon:yes gene_type:complete
MVYLETINPKMTQLLSLKLKERKRLRFEYLWLVLVIWVLGSLSILTYKNARKILNKGKIKRDGLIYS